MSLVSFHLVSKIFLCAVTFYIFCVACHWYWHVSGSPPQPLGSIYAQVPTSSQNSSSAFSQGQNFHPTQSLHDTSTRLSPVTHPAYLELNLTMDEALNPQNCGEPRTRIGFAKTHKTGSSTLMDILLRYALADGLNVVLPVSTSPTAFYSHDRLFSTSARYFSLPAWHKAFVDNSMYHIFTMHTRFNVEEIRQLLGNETVFITILREPAAAFESFYNYGPQFKRHWGGITFAQFVDQLEQDSSFLKRAMEDHHLNKESYDLGARLDIHRMDPDEAAELTIRMLEEEFSLVMLVERMDEALVLLAHELCLPLYRVAAFKKKARREGSKEKVTERQRSILTCCQKLDTLVYDHFARKFQEKVEHFGVERMARSVHELRRLNEQLSDACEAKEISRGPKRGTFGHVTTHKVERTDIEQCLVLSVKSTSQVEYVRKRQEERYKKWRTETRLA